MEALRLKYANNMSSHSFGQLYLWRKNLQLKLYLQPLLYSVTGPVYGENAWLYPVGTEEAKKQFIGDLLCTRGLRMTNLREEDVAFVKTHFPDAFRFEAAPGESEYLYDRAEQLALQGKRFAGIRNHIRRAEKDNVLTAELLDEHNLESAIDVAEDWGRSDREAGEHGIRDDGVPTEMLRLRKELDLHGILVRVNGEPFAVCAGYPLNDTTFDFSLSKLRENLPGLSYWAKHKLYESLPEQFTTINAEDDVGSPGLRTMKYQMRPSGMIDMFHAVAIE